MCQDEHSVKHPDYAIFQLFLSVSRGSLHLITRYCTPSSPLRVMVVKKKTPKVEAVALDEEKLHKLIGEDVEPRLRKCFCSCSCFGNPRESELYVMTCK